MEDIHSPSIAVPANTPETRRADDPAAALFELMAEKDRVEAELKALGAVLDSHKVNMKTSLTTFDGYPRDDIDVPQIRHTRTRIICLQNDYKDLMKRIETGLHAYHAAQAASPPLVNNAPASATITTASAVEDTQTPFAKINSVEPDSPAAEAGMRKGDYIKKFGPVNALNHEKLKKLSQEVSKNDGRQISVLLSRKEAGSVVDLEVIIVPRQWAGHGKLGCHILPL